MSAQTIKKQIRIAALKTLERYDILMAEAISIELADSIHDVIVSRKRVKLTTCPAEWMKVLYRISGVSEFTATPAKRHELSECGQALINSGAELTDLIEFHVWWKSDTWRSDNIPHPSPKQIRDSWGKFQNAGQEENEARIVEVV